MGLQKMRHLLHFPPTHHRHHRRDRRQQYHNKNDEDQSSSTVSSMQSDAGDVVNKHEAKKTTRLSSPYPQTPSLTRRSHSFTELPTIASAEESACKEAPERKVSFSHVEVRSYRRVLGDHPDVDMPLALGWEFESNSAVPIDDFDQRHDEATAPDYADARKMEPLEVGERQHLLICHAGYSRSQVLQEERRRRVQLGLEWSYRNNRSEMTDCDFPKANEIIKRYVV